MNLETLKEIPIKEYLAKKGVYPVKEKNQYGMYLSPLREEKTPSFKVDYNKNLWIDFGTQQGGSIIDVVMQLENCTMPEAICKLKYNRECDPVVTNIKNSTIIRKSAIVIDKVKPLSNPALIAYLKDRKIDIPTAKIHCREIHYTIGDRNYYAVGFENNSGGYELRNRYFKGSTKKDITTINNKSPSCFVFEGFMDYLSYLTINKINNNPDNTVVLNSVTNLNKAKSFITSHKKVYTYLDNDKAGIITTQKLMNSCQSLENKSSCFGNYKDYNDYLVNVDKDEKSICMQQFNNNY